MISQVIETLPGRLTPPERHRSLTHRRSHGAYQNPIGGPLTVAGAPPFWRRREGRARRQGQGARADAGGTRRSPGARLSPHPTRHLIDRLTVRESTAAW